MSLVYVIWTLLENQVGGFAAMSLRFLLLWVNISYDICTPWMICRVFSQSRLQVYVSGLLHHHCLGNPMIENHVIVPKPVAQCWILWYVHQLCSPSTVVINFKKRITETVHILWDIMYYKYNNNIPISRCLYKPTTDTGYNLLLFLLIFTALFRYIHIGPDNF